MARVATRKIGLGAVLVLAFLAMSPLAAAQQLNRALAGKTCIPPSMLPGNWGYPSGWCVNFVVKAEHEAVDPGTTATFTIGPPCPGVTCTVTSNSGCSENKFPCSVAEDGSSVSVDVDPTACGSFEVTISKAAAAGCLQHSASASVRINNTGQGGYWVQCGRVHWFGCNYGYCYKEIDEGSHKVSIAAGGGVSCGSGCVDLTCDGVFYRTVCGSEMVPPCWDRLDEVTVYKWVCSPCP